ncbi:succinate dehydrogenase iron-sulfur subunit [Humisphaera borealis]|uniref:succinate dehydrogenase n=1 Tax=Humisphaera borealis TaxID=2807512 RepID=A0A7M2WVC7_9BACT|nr:succinate dehydrogenase iron-sulfur subunit [Humisphaera borealis]QOV89274.1 succinate dehydrogenase iron-sulfur subunit [Humisphaera borealis]
MTSPANGRTASDRMVTIRIRRQDAPDKPGTQRWEEFSVPHRPQMNIISCLQYIAANPQTTAGKETTTPVWDSGCLEEVCGACTMVINGKARQACSALVDRVGEPGQPITLEPMGKFPLIRDLFVDRSRLFNDLKRVKAWVPIDGTYDLGKGPAVSQKSQETAYPLSRCMSCGCCLEACPQYTPSNHFVGAAVISQARLFNEHPTGKALKEERLEALMGEGGVGDCGKAGNCAEVCPKEIPLLESIAAVQRQATVYSLKKFFMK